MGLNVRSALCIFAAVLGLITLDPAAADDKGGKIPIKKCDKWERPKFVHGKIICVPCGGHRFKKTYVCKHRAPPLARALANSTAPPLGACGALKAP